MTVYATVWVLADELSTGRPVVTIELERSPSRLSEAVAPASSAVVYVSPMSISTLDAPRSVTTGELLSCTTMVSRAEDRSPAEVGPRV